MDKLNFDLLPIWGNPVASTSKKFDEIDISKYEYRGAHDDDTAAQTSKNIYVLDEPENANLKQQFNAAVEQYRDNVLGIGNKLEMTSSWISINKKGHSHKQHKHKGVFISAVYYQQVESGRLYFLENKSMLEKIHFLDYDIKEWTLFNSPRWNIDVKTHDMVLFPGDLVHGTEPNESDTDRIVIGANYFIRGVTGKDENVTRLVL
tara:strand:- start:40 stop:654 length:615 start_codon:yes stop_codon:yes gene_type:complete